jgi:hypothetical protein
MDVVEQREQWRAAFEREYPEELPDRLRWFTDRLGIQPYHLLRLMGLPRAEAEQLAKGPVERAAVIDRYGEESAWWVENKVGYLVTREHDNWHAVREQLRQPSPPGFRVPRPGGWEILPQDLPPEERETVLLTMIADRNSGSFLPLLAYLSQPGPVSPAA